MASARGQLLFDQVGDCRLARAGQPGEPQHSRLLALDDRMGLATDVEMLAMDVQRSPQREMEHSAGDRRVRQLVDQDEAAERPIRARSLDPIRFAYDLAVGRDL